MEDLDSSHHESDLSVQTRIQGHEKSLETNPNDLASRMGLAQAHMQGEVNRGQHSRRALAPPFPCALVRTSRADCLGLPLHRTGRRPPSTCTR